MTPDEKASWILLASKTGRAGLVLAEGIDDASRARQVLLDAAEILEDEPKARDTVDVLREGARDLNDNDCVKLCRRVLVGLEALVKAITESIERQSKPWWKFW